MHPRPHRQSGFTLVELLMTLALMAILMLIAVAPLQKFMHRGKIEGIARQTATLMQLARFEAIKRSVPARVVADGPNDRVFAYAEMSNPPNAVFDAGVDRELGRYKLPNGVAFKAHTGSEEDENAMWNMLGPVGAQYAEFTSDGSVTEHPIDDADRLPAVRFADKRGNELEVDVATRATGRVQLRKWQNGDYRVQGENDQPWEWF